MSLKVVSKSKHAERTTIGDVPQGGVFVTSESAIGDPHASYYMVSDERDEQEDDDWIIIDLTDGVLDRYDDDMVVYLVDVELHV